MIAVNITELRQHLSSFIDKVQADEEIVITQRGKAVARIVPEYAESPANAAMKQLDALRGSVILGDVMAPFADEEWGGVRTICDTHSPAVLG